MVPSGFMEMLLIADFGSLIYLKEKKKKYMKLCILNYNIKVSIISNYNILS